MTTNTWLLRFVCCSLVAAIACSGLDDEIILDPAAGEPPPGSASSSEDNTYDHPDTIADIWKLLERMQQEGPPTFTSRVHGCPKMRYATIGNVLASLGVNLGAGGQNSAGAMYRTSEQALGAPNYAARSRENLELTTASASKLFDIYTQAAPEIIAAMPTLARCTVGAKPTQMFNEFDQCTPDGIACLTGLPAQAAHLELCNEIVHRASSIDAGKTIAVASILSAAHTCE